MLYTPLSSLSCEMHWSKEPLPFEQRREGTKRLLSIGESWGGLFDCGWFHFTGVLPENETLDNVVIRIDISGEGLLFGQDGTPLMGLTNIHSIFDRYWGCTAKRELPATLCTQDGHTVDIWVDGGCNDLAGGSVDNGVLALANVSRISKDALGLFYDLEVLYSVYNATDKKSARARQIFNMLKKAVVSLSSYSLEEIRMARNILKPALDTQNGYAPVTLTAIGHAHLDLAWLWPERESVRKGARTFATALRMMDWYPEYIFGASQAQLYQWIKDYYPGLYSQVKNKVAEGKWDVQGAMWVEADTNLAGGEALIRQILYGKSFFKQEFGLDIQVLWLPDVFGYTAAFPQILVKCGVPYFFTNKLCFNTNRIPHHTFHWQGIDGSKVLVHMTPADTYGSRLFADELKRAQDSYCDADVSNEAIILYGVSDGGGGPGKEHLERLRRLRNFDQMPPMNPGTTQKFFSRLKQNSDQYAIWNGELYFENHQGTYTTQAKTKQGNRCAETAIRNCEIVCAIAEREVGFAYPSAALERIWKRVLFFQFHDILPGSSIKRVYDEAETEYAALLSELENITREAGLALECKEMNLTSIKYSGYRKVDGQWYKASAEPFSTVKYSPVSNVLQGLENEALRLVIDEDGAITSIIDKECKRELLKHGTTANRFTVYPDDADAWELPVGYQSKPKEYFRQTASWLIVDGPVTVYRAKYAYLESTIQQDIILAAGDREIRFITTVDWRETGKLLRTNFDIDIVCTEAVCGIQFGQLNRTTHTNTSWDAEKFEICANRYVDLSESGYGVAMMSDSKYGYNVKGNALDLCLLRSSMWPSEDADKGIHTFVYTLYPHMGNTAQSGVAQKAELLNRPPFSFNGNQAIGSYIAVNDKNILVETLKKAENGDGYILRLYEAYGQDTYASLTVKEMTECMETDMLEHNSEPLTVDNHTVTLHFKPYEILTLRFH